MRRPVGRHGPQGHDGVLQAVHDVGRRGRLQEDVSLGFVRTELNRRSVPLAFDGVECAAELALADRQREEVLDLGGLRAAVGPVDDRRPQPGGGRLVGQMVRQIARQVAEATQLGPVPLLEGRRAHGVDELECIGRVGDGVAVLLEHRPGPGRLSERLDMALMIGGRP